MFGKCLEKVYARWIDIRARNIKKSHRESRPRPSTKEHEQQCNGSEESEHEDREGEVRDEVQEDEVHGTEDQETAQNVVAYVVEAGFMVMDAPDEESFKKLIGF